MYGEILKNLRISKNLTQQQLAEILGFKSASAVGMFEREEREINFEKIDALTRFFNISSDYLMGITPFKNDAEAYFSISIAAIKELRNNPELSPKKLKDYYAPITSLYENVVNDTIVSYCYDLILKYVNKNKLTNLELFEVSNIIFSSIKWTPDYNGIVYLEYSFYNFFPESIQLNFKEIEKIDLDLSKSTLFDFKDGTNTFIRYNSTFAQNFGITNNLNHKNKPSNNITKDVYPTGKNLKGTKLSDDFQNAEQAFKFILSQPVLAAYGGYELDKMAADDIIELANDMLFALRLSLERMRRKR